MSNSTMSAAILATIRPGTSAWAVLEAEYDALHAEAVVLSAEDQAEEADATEVCGIVNRHEFYSSNEVDNARYDAGFWGSRKGLARTHCGAKSKRTMIRKRGRV